MTKAENITVVDESKNSITVCFQMLVHFLTSLHIVTFMDLQLEVLEVNLMISYRVIIREPIINISTFSKNLEKKVHPR